MDDLWALLDGDIDFGLRPLPPPPPPPPAAPVVDKPTNGRALEVNGNRYWIKVGMDGGGTLWSVYVATSEKAHYGSMDGWMRLYLTTTKDWTSSVSAIPNEVFSEVDDMLPHIAEARKRRWEMVAKIRPNYDADDPDGPDEDGVFN